MAARDAAVGPGDEVITQINGDLDGDGFVNGAALTILLGAWGEVKPQIDLDGDNVVDVTDILQVIAKYGPCSSCIEDMDDDGFVGVYEILTILDSWGPC